MDLFGCAFRHAFVEPAGRRVNLPPHDGRAKIEPLQLMGLCRKVHPARCRAVRIQVLGFVVETRLSNSRIVALEASL